VGEGRQALQAKMGGWRRRDGEINRRTSVRSFVRSMVEEEEPLPSDRLSMATVLIFGLMCSVGCHRGNWRWRRMQAILVVFNGRCDASRHRAVTWK
jgi:hypothetical protein